MYSGNYNSNLWIVGESPTFDDKQKGQPFSGRAGEVLDQVLGMNGISRNDCFLCHLDVLMTKMHHHIPNVIICFGEQVLSELLNRHNINNWRGSIIWDKGIKCIPTFTPESIIYNQKNFAIFAIDIQRAVKESKSDVYFEFNPNILFGQALTQDLIDSYAKEEVLSIDIETVTNTSIIRSVGFAKSSTHSIVFNFENHLHRLWIRLLLSCPAIKVMQNGIFDRTQLALNGFEVNNYVHDTNIMGHVLNPELPRDLSFLNSVYTDIPYYESDYKTKDANRLYIYNGNDCVSTYQNFIAMYEDIKADESLLRIYNYEIEMNDVAFDMGMNGMLVDEERRSIIRDILTKRVTKLQAYINTICELDLNINSTKQVQLVLYKSFKLPIRTNKNAKGESVPTTDDDALISLMNHVLTKINELKTDKAKSEWNLKLAFIKIVMEMRGINKLLSSYINITLSLDGKCRSTWKATGTETGRWSAGLFVDGTGCGLQTLPRGDVRE